jgi:acetylornithine/N-succinyldiaminopimelate aminotransferase
MTRSERDDALFIHTYKRLPLEVDRGAGVYLYATDGTRYLDLFAGVAVNALGYGHPRVLQAIEEQARKYIHVSNYFAQDPQVELAGLLTRHSGYPRIFFTNSGTESVEGALKIARRWGSARGKDRIVSLSNAFHGRSYGALSLMDRPKYREGFGPFLDGCTTVSFNDPGALREAVSPSTAALFLEFIQGEGGIRPVSDEFVRTLSELRERFGFLVIADEIQSGLGRTGRFFGFQHFDLRPDCAVMAKPIGGGLPLGAILATEEVASVLAPGMHGTTFGGNPVACAAGVAVVREVMEHGVIENSAAIGAYLLEGLERLQKEFPGEIAEVRGRGLMVGCELTSEAEPVVTAMRERKILVNGTDQTVIRFVPPLIIGREHVDAAITALAEIFRGRRGGVEG